MSKKSPKYIFVSGGVLSGLGKGITAASIGTILEWRGLKVNAQKLDPYLNVDAGTLNPAEHGECFVTYDGAETDLDLGHYERFLDVELTQLSSMMSGRILLKLIEDERQGKYLGKTVQVVPHLTTAIQDATIKASEGFDVHVVEIGGTVGDAESPAFFEAIRGMAERVGRENCFYVQVVYLPYLGASKETKTKPAQNAARELRSLGISPDMLVARCEEEPEKDVINKLSAFCGVDKEAVALLPNADTVYRVPLTLEEEGIADYICNKLSLPKKASKASKKKWQDLVKRATKKYEQKYKIGIIAKYLDNEDTYISVFEAIEAAAWARDVGVDIVWIDAEKIEEKGLRPLSSLDAIIIPGGFGSRGSEGKIKAATYALENKLPYLGLCLGMQVAAIAQARLAGLEDANSEEFDRNTKNPVISTMADQKEVIGTGGTMRLGNYDCELEKGSLARTLYGKAKIVERHRHRYEFNNEYRDLMLKNGMKLSGQSPDKKLVEIIEKEDHPFFIASQFHPEFKSRPMRPHPMFDGLIKTLKKHKQL